MLPPAANRLFDLYDHAVEWTARHTRLLFWVGLAVVVLMTYAECAPYVTFPPDGVARELSRKEDIHNLYFAAAQARWRDVPGWFYGPWLYPGVGFYRPLTSVLFVTEFHAFHRDFTAWNWVSAAMTILNGVMLYALTVSLFRGRPRAGPLLGLAAVFYFVTGASSMDFAVRRILMWWPAQNDALSLLFALLFLLLLDTYLLRPRAGWLAAALLSLYASIGAKEMGFIVAPMGLALVWHRRASLSGARVPVIAPTVGVTALTGFLWFARRILVPTHWGPVMFRWLIVKKGIDAFGGPPAHMAHAGIWWPAVAGATVIAVGGIGLRRRWKVGWIAACCLIAAGLVMQLMPDAGTAFLLLEGLSQERLLDVVAYVLAALLFWRYRRGEPGLLSGACLLLCYLPILHYGGAHYFYWPGAFNALADAAFIACLWRWAGELKRTANWGFAWPTREALLRMVAPAAALAPGGETAIISDGAPLAAMPQESGARAGNSPAPTCRSSAD